MDSIGWIRDRWHDVTHAGSGSWLAAAAWVALALGVVALLYTHRQIQRSRRLAAEQYRPQVAMFMEPHASDWHVIELVVRNFGQTTAYDVEFAFAQPPTVARYESAPDGYSDVAELRLPHSLAALASGQEWRTVWDSALDRAELGASIESRFAGSITYYDQPADAGRPWQRKRRQFETPVVLDWDTLPPVQRIELMTNHDRAKREKQKLELLRHLLSYFHYATKETRPEVFRSEIERIKRAAEETQDRWRLSQLDAPTDVRLRWGEAGVELGRHRQRV